MSSVDKLGKLVFIEVTQFSFVIVVIPSFGDATGLLIVGVRSNRLARIDPFRVHVHRIRQGYRIRSLQNIRYTAALTIDTGLERLAAHLAQQMAHAHLLIHRARNTLLMVAEQTRKRRV